MIVSEQRHTDAFTHTCLVEDLVNDVAVVREVVFPTENHTRDLDQEALSDKTHEKKEPDMAYTCGVRTQIQRTDICGLQAK